MKLARLCATILVAFLATFLVGCGGGGGGGNPGGAEDRSVNLVTGTFGSRFFHDNVVAFHWVGNNTGNDYGVVVVETATKRSGVSPISIVQNGRILVDNVVTKDSVTFDFTTHHAVGDPKAGQPLSGTATFDILPEDPRVDPSIGNPFAMPADGTLPMAVQAQNSRAAGAKIVLWPQSSRAYVNTDATWSVSPTNAGTVTKNTNGTATFNAKSGFSGAVTITAALQGFAGPFTATISGNVVAHPSIIVSSPAEGSTVKGTVAVQYTASNANRVTYSIDGGTTVDTTDGSFNWDTTTVANGNHTITMKAYGQFETASLVRSVTVNNPAPPQHGKLVLDGGPISTNSDGAGIANHIGGKSSNGTICAVGSNNLSTLDSSGNVSRTSIDVDNTQCAVIGDKNLIAIPDPQHSQVLVYNTNRVLVKTLSGFGYVQGADYYYHPDNPTLLVASSIGIYKVDVNTWNRSLLISGSFSRVSGDGQNVWATEFVTLGHTKIFNSSGAMIIDLGLVPGVTSIRTFTNWDLVAISTAGGTDGAGFYQFALDGTAIGFNNLGITGWQGFDRDGTDPSKCLAARGDASLQGLHAVPR